MKHIGYASNERFEGELHKITTRTDHAVITYEQEKKKRFSIRIYHLVILKSALYHPHIIDMTNERKAFNTRYVLHYIQGSDKQQKESFIQY
jgi:hypothetical protein